MRDLIPFPHLLPSPNSKGMGIAMKRLNERERERSKWGATIIGRATDGEEKGMSISK